MPIIKRMFLFRLLALLMLASQFYFFLEAGRINIDSLSNRVMYQTWSFPQEKVYVVTDKNAYVSGDTIWLRAFLVDASSHGKPALSSKYIYIDIINPFGDKQDRIKIIEKEGIFAGIIPLDEDLPEGNYTLCAYTQFMQNSAQEYYFKKSIPLFSPLSSKYKFEINNSDGTLKAALFEKGSDRPVRAENISIIGPKEQYFASRIRHRSNYSMKINEKMRQAGYVIVKFDKYEKFVSIPYDTTSFSISFHPEGGHLIPNVTNRLAFKAIDKMGLSKNISGYIIDDTGQLICDFKSDHKGMGMVEFLPLTEKSYHAIIDSKSYPIPDADMNTCALSISSLDIDSLDIRVLGHVPDNFYILAHNAGVVTYQSDISKKEMRVARDGLGSGIIQFMLMDDIGNILSSRMIFNHNGYIYGESIDSIPQGDYAVTTSVNSKADNTSSIVSSLLLQSELKGLIEDPDYYFINRDSIKDTRLDLLLLTQGWERYDYQAAMLNNYSQPEVSLEIGGEISGVVRSRWRGKPLKDAMVLLISPQLNYADQAITDDEGHFVFNGLDWPDDTIFIIQVLSKDGNKEHNYAIDNLEPQIPGYIFTGISEASPDDLIDYSLLTAGTIMLDELVVTAPLTAEESRREMLAALGVRSFTADEMEKQHITTYEEVLRKIPGIRIVNGNVVSSFARAFAFDTGMGGAPVEYWIDGSQWTPTAAYSASTPEKAVHMYNSLNEFAASYPFHIIESIEYFRPSTAMIISLSAAQSGGALVITTKDGSKIKEWDADLFMRSFTPLGYQNKPEAYNPHFIYDPTSDEGLYKAAWWPILTDLRELSEFNEYDIVIEGLTIDNQPVYIKSLSPKSSTIK